LSSKNNKVISWVKTLNAEIDSTISSTTTKSLFAPIDNNDEYLFCGKTGSIIECIDCKNYLSCFDQHCEIDNEKYKIDYVVSKLGFDVFVMIDDNFWHGLGLSNEQINNPKSGIERMISEICFRDNYFNEHCKSEKIPLVRFSTREISLFASARSEILYPYFSCGPKRKLKKFFDLYTNSIDLLFSNIFNKEEIKK
jgi:hypothetical protein